MSTNLMTSRRFAPLFWCQFFSAFNDNFLKNALGFLIVFHIGSAGAASLNTLALAIFITPYFIVSGLGGQLADRFDKAVVARRLKLAEIFVVGVAIAGFAMHAVLLLFVPSRWLLRLFLVPGVILFPLTYLELLKGEYWVFATAIFFCGLLTVAQMSYMSEFLPRVSSVYGWEAPGPKPRLLLRETIRCPECRRLLVPQVGHVGGSLEAARLTGKS